VGVSEPPAEKPKRSKRVYIYWAVALALLLAAGLFCWLVVVPCREDPAPPPPITAGSVIIEKYEIKAGQAAPQAVRQGLQSMADHLATLVRTARKKSPQLYGTFSGTLHIEPDGTIRMFAEEASDIRNESNGQIVGSFVGAIFGKKVKFPRVGDNLLLYVFVRIRAKQEGAQQ